MRDSHKAYNCVNGAGRGWWLGGPGGSAGAALPALGSCLPSLGLTVTSPDTMNKKLMPQRYNHFSFARKFLKKTDFPKQNPTDHVGVRDGMFEMRGILEDKIFTIDGNIRSNGMGNTIDKMGRGSELLTAYCIPL